MAQKSKIDLNKYWSPAFNTMLEFVYLLDKDFNIVKVNKAVVDFTKKDENSLTGVKCYAALYDADKPLTKDCPYKRMLKSKRFETLELFIPHREKWLNIRANPIFDEKNILAGGIIFSEDITAHKKIEEEKEKLLKAVENAREAVSITGEGLRIIYTNNALNKLFGYKKGELIGKEVTILNQEEGKEELAAKIINSLNKRGSWEGEIPDKRKDGTKFVSFVTISAIKDKKGKLLNAIATQHDITERKKAEKLLRQSEEGFRVTFENAKDAIFWADIETAQVVKCNKAAEKLLERDRKEIEGNSHALLFPREKIEFYNNMFRRHLKKGGAFDEPAEIITKSGKIKPILITSSLTTIGGKKIMWGIFHDISERKKTESALRESEEKFRTLAEESPNMIFINKKGKVIYANKKCEEIMGYKKSVFYSDKFDFMSTVDPKDHKKVKNAFIRHMRGEDVPPYEYTLILRNGNKMEVIITTKLMNYGGEKAILGIITDITERKQIEKMKDTLICDVSHSLKTPIAVTAMALEVCKGAMQVNDLAQIKRSHAIAHSNIKKAHKDVNNILEIFTLETGQAKRQKSKKEKSSLTSIINEISKGLSYLIQDKGLKINIDIPENAKDVIIGRKDAVILMNNLMDNSIKFTEKGSISIKSRLEGSEVEISVQDTGCGIEPKHINKVFEKFYKRHPAVDGSGLGLAICKEIVHLYKGKIEARSKGKNQGTTIIVRLPKA